MVMEPLKTVDYALIAKRLKETRIKRHLRQKDVAEAMKMTENYISRLESGTVPILLENLYTFASIYQCSVIDFLTPESENQEDYLLTTITRLAESASQKQREQILRIIQILLEGNESQ